MFHNVAVKHEASHNLGVGERNDQLRLARFPVQCGRNTEGVAKAVEICWDAVYFCDKKSGLMNMKVVILRIFV